MQVIRNARELFSNLFLNILWGVFQTCTKRLQELEGSLKCELLLNLVEKKYRSYPNDPLKMEKTDNKYNVSVLCSVVK